VARVGGIIGQVEISALIPGRDGISAAFVFVGRVDVFGLPCPAFVFGFVGFRLFVVVEQAAASESTPGFSLPFNSRAIRDTTSSIVVARVAISFLLFKSRVIGDAAISTTCGVGLGDD